jgi:RNA polymerase-binding transcription factor DksA
VRELLNPAMDAARASSSPMPLTPLERLQLRDRLQELWREQVETLSTAAVRAHTASPEPGSESVARQLSTARIKLTELEAAMHRMDARRFGLCEVCAGAIEFEDLLVRPQARRCPTCAAEANDLPNQGPSSDPPGMASQERS